MLTYYSPFFAAGPRSRAGAVVDAPAHAQVRGPNGRARILSRRNGIVQAVVGAWACGARFLSGFVGVVTLSQSPVGATVVAPYHAQVRRPSGRARVLSRGNGFVQAVVGTWACGAKILTGFVSTVV